MSDLTRNDNSLASLAAYGHDAGDSSEDELEKSVNKETKSEDGDGEAIDDPILNISGSDDEASTKQKDSDERVAKRSHTPSPLPSPKPQTVQKKKATRLVSYGPDDLEEDEVEDEIADDQDFKGIVDYDVSVMEADTSVVTASIYPVSSDEVKLPPEPSGKCSNRLQEKIAKFYDKVQNQGLDLNASIQRRKDFRNPSIYEKLIQFIGIDEKGTNYPSGLYDPSIWGPESYYDELAKVQKAEMDRREKEKKERTKVEFVTGTKKSTGTAGDTGDKRKSKWDSQALPTTVKVITTTASNPPTISVTLSSSGTKTTVISTVGNITKKTTTK